MQDFASRRRAIFACAAAVLSAATASAQAQLNQGPVRVIVAFPPGGTADVLARVLAQKMRTILDVEVIVENKPGATGVIAAEAAVRSAPDGRTMLLANPALVQAPSVISHVSFDPVKDLEPLCAVARGSTVLVVPASLPVSTVSELIVLARANPGKHSIGNYGRGSSSHIQAVALATQAGIDVVQVSYRGAVPLVIDLLGGQITAGVSDFTAALPHVRSGKLKVLAVTGSRPTPAFPGVPTLASLGYRSVDMDGWMGMFLPSGVPAPISAKLFDAVSRAAASPEVRERVESIGMRPDLMEREEFVRMVRRDAQAWARVIADTKVRAE